MRLATCDVLSDVHEDAVDLRLLLILLLAAPLGMSAAAVAARAWRGQRRANAARAWPRTTGRVLSSNVREVMVRTRSSVGITTYRMTTGYVPYVVYTYVVDGAQYQAERLRMGESISSSDTRAAEQAVARYPAGADVTVYYNPADPADATLDPRTTWGTRILWMVVLLLLAITAVVVVVFLSSPPIRWS
jgi:hypothetical protein